MNTSIKVVLFTSKTLSNGEHPVLLRITKDRKPKYLSIGFSCAKQDWNPEDNLPKRKHPLYKQVKILIAKKILDAEKLIYDLENEDKHLSSSELKRKLKKGRGVTISLLNYFDSVVGRLKAAGQIKTAEVYKDTKRNVCSFTRGADPSFFEIDVQFLNRFEEHLKALGKGSNTIYIYLRTLRALINKAIKEEICSEKHYAFKHFSLARYAKIKTEKRAISKEDIRKISELDLGKHPHLKDAHHIFLFSFYLRGMNFIDIAFLKWRDIKKGRLIYTRKKTKELFNIELLPPVLPILAHYNNEFTGKGPDSYVFPLLKDSHTSPTSIYNRKMKMMNKINSDLKEIASLCGLACNLTTYVSRHSYATILKKNGVPVAKISQAMGHDSEKTTQIYLESFENIELDEASKMIL